MVMFTFEREVSRQIIGSRRRYLPHKSEVPLRLLYLRERSCKLSYVSTGMVKRGDFDLAIKELVTLLATIAIEAGWLRDPRALKIVTTELGVKETAPAPASELDSLVFNDDVMSSDEDSDGEHDDQHSGEHRLRCDHVKHRRAMSATVSPLQARNISAKLAGKPALGAGAEKRVFDDISESKDEQTTLDEDGDPIGDDIEDRELEIVVSNSSQDQFDESDPRWISPKRQGGWSTLSSRLAKLDIFSETKLGSSLANTRSQSSASIASMNKPAKQEPVSPRKTAKNVDKARIIESVIMVLDAILSSFTQNLVDLGLVPHTAMLPDNADQQQYTDPLWTTNHWPGVFEVPALPHPTANALLAIIEELLPSRRSDAVFASVFDYDGKSQLTNVVMNVAQYLYIANTQLCEGRAAAALAGWPGRTRLELLLVTCPTNIAVEHRMKLISTSLHRLDEESQQELLMHTCSCVVRLISQDPRCKWASAKATQIAIKELISTLAKSRALHPFRTFRLADNLVELLLEIVYACVCEEPENGVKMSMGSHWGRVAARSKPGAPWEKCWERIATAYKKELVSKAPKDKGKPADCVVRVGFIAWIAHQQSYGLNGLYKQVAVTVSELAESLSALAPSMSPVLRMELLMFFSEFAPDRFEALLPSIVRDRLLLQFLRGVHVFAKDDNFHRVFRLCSANFNKMVITALDNNNHQTSFAAFDLALDLPSGECSEILRILTEFNHTRIIMDPAVREIYELFAVHFAKRERKADRPAALAKLIPTCMTSEWLSCPERACSLLLVLRLLANGRRVVPLNIFETGPLATLPISFLELRVNLLVGICNNSRRVVRACLRCLELLQADSKQSVLERDLIAELLDTKQIDDAPPNVIRKRLAYLLATRAKCDTEQCDPFCAQFVTMLDSAIEETSTLTGRTIISSTSHSSANSSQAVVRSPAPGSPTSLSSSVSPLLMRTMTATAHHPALGNHTHCLMRQMHKSLIRIRVAALTCNTKEERLKLYKYFFTCEDWILRSILEFTDLVPEIAHEFFNTFLDLMFETGAATPTRAQLLALSWLLSCMVMDVRDKNISTIVLAYTPDELRLSELCCYVVTQLKPSSLIGDENAVFKLLEQCASFIVARDLETSDASTAAVFRPVVQCLLARDWKDPAALMKTLHHLFDAYVEPDYDVLSDLLTSLIDRFSYDDSYSAITTLLHANLPYALQLCGVGCPSSDSWQKRVTAYSSLSWHYAQTFTTSGFVLESNDMVSFMTKYPAIMFALCDVCSIDGNDTLAESLLTLFRSHNVYTEIKLVEMMLKHEVTNVSSEAQLFRTNSVAVQIILRWVRKQAKQYNKELILPAASLLRAASMREHVTDFDTLFGHVVHSLGAPRLPASLSWFFQRVIYEVTERFNSEVASIAVSVLFVLRTICPTIVDLNRSGVVDRAPSREMSLLLRKFAVYLQHRQVEVKDNLLSGSISDNMAHLPSTLETNAEFIPWTEERELQKRYDESVGSEGVDNTSEGDKQSKESRELALAEFKKKRGSLTPEDDSSSSSRQVFHFLRQHAVEVRIVLQSQNDAVAIKELHKLFRLGKLSAAPSSSARSYMAFAKPIKFMQRSGVLFDASEIISSDIDLNVVSKEFAGLGSRPLVLDFTRSSHLIDKWEEIFYSAKQSVFNRVNLVMLNCPRKLFDVAMVAKRDNKLDCKVYFVSSCVEEHRNLFDYLPPRAKEAVEDIKNAVTFECTAKGGLDVTAYVGAHFMQLQMTDLSTPHDSRSSSSVESVGGERTLTSLLTSSRSSSDIHEYVSVDFEAPGAIGEDVPETPTEVSTNLFGGGEAGATTPTLAPELSLDTSRSDDVPGSPYLVSPLTAVPRDYGADLLGRAAGAPLEDERVRSRSSSSASSRSTTSQLSIPSPSPSPSPAPSIISSVASSPSAMSESSYIPLIPGESFRHATCNVLSYSVSGSRAANIMETRDSLSFVCGDVAVEFEHPSPNFARVLKLSAMSAEKTIAKTLSTRLDAVTTGSLLFTSLIDMGSELPEVREHAAELYAVFPYALGLDLRVLSLQECSSFNQIIALSSEAASLYPELASSVIQAFVSLGTRIGANEAQIAAPWLPVLVVECRNNGTLENLKARVLKPLLRIAAGNVETVNSSGDAQTSKEAENEQATGDADRSGQMKLGSNFTDELSCAAALREYFWPVIPGLSNLIADLLVDLAVSGYDLEALCQIAATCSSKDGSLDARKFAKYFLSRLYQALLTEKAVPPAPANTLWSTHKYWPLIEACASLFASVSMDPENAEHLFIDQAFLVCAFAGIGSKRLRVLMRMMFINYVHAFMQLGIVTEYDALRERALRGIHAKLIGPKGKALFGVAEFTSVFTKPFSSSLNAKKAIHASAGSSLILSQRHSSATGDDFAHDLYDSCPAGVVEELCKTIAETAAAVFGLRSRFQTAYTLLTERISLYANDRYPALYRRCILAVPATARLIMQSSTIQKAMKSMGVMLLKSPNNVKAGLLSAYLRMFATSVECIPEASGYPQRLFWLACTCLATCNLSILPDSLRLLHQVLKVGQLRGTFRRTSAVELFLGAKPKFLSIEINDPKYKLALSLPSSEQNFHLSLATLLLVALNSREYRSRAIECCEVLNSIFPNELIYCLCLLISRTSGLPSLVVNANDTFAKDATAKELSKRLRYDDIRGVIALSVVTHAVQGTGSCIRLLDFVSYIRDRRVISAVEPLLRPSFTKLLEKNDPVMEDRLAEWTLGIFSHSAEQRIAINGLYSSLSKSMAKFGIKPFAAKAVDAQFAQSVCDNLAGKWYL